MHVGGHGLPGLNQQRAEDVLGGPPLVGGDKVLEPKDLADGFFQPEVRPRSGIGFVTQHDRCPLRLAHRAGARVGQQVNEDIFGVQVEYIETRFLQGRSRA